MNCKIHFKAQHLKTAVCKYNLIIPRWRYENKHVSSTSYDHKFTYSFCYINSDIRYNLKLDADLQSSRVSSRGQFSNSDRVLQKDISVTVQDTCEEHDVYVQESPDLVNSIALRVDVVLGYPDADPVLDAFSLSAWEFFVSDTNLWGTVQWQFFIYCRLWSLSDFCYQHSHHMFW